jgi:hypothetical protein
VPDCMSENKMASSKYLLWTWGLAVNENRWRKIVEIGGGPGD